MHGSISTGAADLLVQFYKKQRNKSKRLNGHHAEMYGSQKQDIIIILMTKMKISNRNS
jgi:hypothetical protein